MFTLLFGAFTVLAVLLVFFGFYLFAAYVFYRLGEKFRIGSFVGFLIPGYNVMLLCDCAAVTRWLTVAILAPGFVQFVMNALSLYMFAQFFESVSGLIGVVASVYLWGSIARRLGKNFWLWGIGTTILLGLPALILAFDGSMPQRHVSSHVSSDGETRYIDI